MLTIWNEFARLVSDAAPAFALGRIQLDRILRTRQRQFRLRLFLRHFRGALPGHCGPLAEMLDSVTAKKVRSRRILFKSGSCEQYSGIVSDERREMGRKSRSATSHTSRRRPGSPANHQRRAGDEEMGLIRAMHSRHGVRARWGYGDRNMDFATLPDDARIGKTWERRTTSDVSRCLPLSQRPNDQSHMAETPRENPMAHVHRKAMFV